jgi:hypothetical protein
MKQSKDRLEKDLKKNKVLFNSLNNTMDAKKQPKNDNKALLE